MNSKEQQKKRIVQDTKGASYELKKELNRGGQGAVYTTTSPNVLIKGFSSEAKKDEVVKRWRQQIEWLVRQDFSGLKIAKPLIMLAEPRNGYVMELMDGLVPLQSLLDSFVEAEEDAAQDYIAKGGLKRRLRILCQLASTLNQLHNRGMLYGDLSPSNIFVSDDPEHAETWLIDCDNISFASHNNFALYTQDYGAPEVVRGEANLSSLTDVWSFAVIAYQLLTHNHPFKGEMVKYGDPEIEEEALRGKHPWINDSQDIDNECTSNLPMQLMAYSRLPELFKQCFEQGKSQPIYRPSIAEWLEALSECDERLVCCNGCGAHNIFSGNTEECFFCSEQPDLNIVIFDEFIAPGLDDGTVSFKTEEWLATGRQVIFQPGDEKELKRLLPTFAYDRWPTDNLLISYIAHKGIIINVTANDTVHLQRGEQIKPLEKSQGLSLAKREPSANPFWLHTGPLNEQHIVWQFRW